MKKKIRFDAKFGLKMTERFWKKKILKGWKCIFTIFQRSPLREGCWPSFGQLESPSVRDVLFLFGPLILGFLEENSTRCMLFC